MNNKMLKFNAKQKGFSLVGVLGAAFIALLVLTALLAMISQIFSLGKVSKNKFVAVNLAKEGIELVRNMRDSNWFYYPATNNGDIVQTMAWRGCEAGDSSPDCAFLKNLCDGGPYKIDALDDNLVLGDASASADQVLKQAAYGTATVFTHQAGGADSIFSRTITINTEDPASPAEYIPEADSGCGETADFSVATNPSKLKPRGFVVESRVSWTEPGTGEDKEVVLTGHLYDWLTKRP